MKLDLQTLVDDLDRQQHQFLVVLSVEQQGGKAWQGSHGRLWWLSELRIRYSRNMDFSRVWQTVSRLAEYIELAAHLRSNSKLSMPLTFSSSRRVEQKEGLYEPDFCLEQIYAWIFIDIERSTYHTGLHVLEGPIHELFHLFLPNYRVLLKTRAGHPERNML